MHESPRICEIRGMPTDRLTSLSGRARFKKSTLISGNQRDEAGALRSARAFSSCRGERLLLDGLALNFRIIDIALPELDVDYSSGKEDNDRGFTIVAAEYPAIALSLSLSLSCRPLLLASLGSSSVSLECRSCVEYRG
jgi:hypothetical protein